MQNDSVVHGATHPSNKTDVEDAKLEELIAALDGWDGRQVASLIEIAKIIPVKLSSVQWLIRAMETGTGMQSVGASWILLNISELYFLLNHKESNRLISVLKNATKWQTQLHLLQLLAQLPLEKLNTSKLTPVVMDLMQHKRPFIRAWAYNAAICLSGHSPERLSELMSIIGIAYPQEKASVQARIRQALTARGCPFPWDSPPETNP